ncbi:predicted protein [Naegleria gruberi]|uniref:Predicted protein n=1 Tax=Naegleria gruberi TaxID=5762 RepID=D2V5N3_NAEGR|nr:uncharacterized protein NAEGRDRAFT_46869 [Naegleria gruberi]EFC47679.1 predicted protein [Naegleria gruberi]|eukprot:XP_002680423.1 predicted protein [Naegleria gruberi strain NEG-M]
MSQQGLPTRSKRIRNDKEEKAVDQSDENDAQEEKDVTLLDREEKEGLFETVGGLAIEKLEEKDCNIQSHFSMSNDTGSVVVIDQGSSFSKGMIFTKDSNGKFKEESIRFNVTPRAIASEFARTILYYTPSTDEYFLYKNPNSDSIPIHSLKKLFTVLEANTYIVKDENGTSFPLNVSLLMFKFIEKLLSAITWRKKQTKFTRKVDTFIFTVPTGTPQHVKALYKLNIFKAIQKCFEHGSALRLNNIYVIEEYLLLYYANINEQSTDQILMIIDFGHLTADVTVIDKLQTIIYANGEVGGVSMFHKVIEELTNENPFDVMRNIFESQDSVLPEKYQWLDKPFREVCKEIIQPILDAILQTNPEQVVLCGAFISNGYFKELVKSMLNFDKLQQYYDGNDFIRKDEFKPQHFEIVEIENPGSALLVGAANMLQSNAQNISFSNGLPAIVNIPIDFERKLLPFQTKIAFLFEDEYTNQVMLKLTKNDNFLYVKQDVEIFILKIRNTIDMEKKRFKIPRIGRMERIPITDVLEIFTTEEEEDTTWYGTKYDLNMVVTDSRVHRVDKSQLSELDENDFKILLSKENVITKEDRTEYIENYESNIPAQEKGDANKYCEQVNFKCICCGKAIQNGDQKHKFTSRTVYRFREAFGDNNIHPGSSCHDCFKIQRNYFDRKRGSKKRK